MKSSAAGGDEVIVDGGEGVVVDAGGEGVVVDGSEGVVVVEGGGGRSFARVNPSTAGGEGDGVRPELVGGTSERTADDELFARGGGGRLSFRRRLSFARRLSVARGEVVGGPVTGGTNERSVGKGVVAA